MKLRNSIKEREKMAKDEEEVKNNVFGFGDPNDAFTKYFSGKSYLKGLAMSKAAKTGRI